MDRHAFPAFVLCLLLGTATVYWLNDGKLRHAPLPASLAEADVISEGAD